MIQIYKSISETNSSLQVLDSIENGCWINIVAPSEEELILISKKTGVPLNFKSTFRWWRNFENWFWRWLYISSSRYTFYGNGG